MFQVYDVALIPIIIGLVEILKGIGLPKKLMPFISVILGLAAGDFLRVSIRFERRHYSRVNAWPVSKRAL